MPIPNFIFIIYFPHPHLFICALPENRMTLSPTQLKLLSTAEAHAKWEDVIAILLPLSKSNHPDEEILCRLGEAYWHLMKINDARALFEQVLVKNPRSARAWFGVASVTIAKGFMLGNKSITSLEALQKAAEIEPTNPDYVYAYTFQLSMKGDFATEADFFEKILPKHPDAGNYLYLSDCYLKLNEPQKAIDAIERALKLDSTKKSAYPRLGAANEALGKVGGAIAAYQKAMTLEKEEKMKKKLEEKIMRLQKTKNSALNNTSSSSASSILFLARRWHVEFFPPRCGKLLSIRENVHSFHQFLASQSGSFHIYPRNEQIRELETRSFSIF